MPQTGVMYAFEGNGDYYLRIYFVVVNKFLCMLLMQEKTVATIIMLISIVANGKVTFSPIE